MHSCIEGQRPDGSLHRVVVDFDPAVFEKEAKASTARQRVADRLGELGFLADQRQLLVQPRLGRGILRSSRSLGEWNGRPELRGAAYADTCVPLALSVPTHRVAGHLGHPRDIGEGEVVCSG